MSPTSPVLSSPTALRDDCQLKRAQEEADRSIGPWERAWLYALKFGRRLRGIVRRRVVALRWARAGAPPSTRIKPLELQPGELVCVKQGDAIAQTLDEERSYQGLCYIPTTMDRYCGGTHRVFKRVTHFFDERTRRVVKLKDVVILAGVYCDGSSLENEGRVGCDRSCFLFWKEAWLERVAPAPSDVKGPVGARLD